METKETNTAVWGGSGSDEKEQLGSVMFGVPMKLMNESRDGPRMLEQEALFRDIQAFKNKNQAFWSSGRHPGWLSFIVAELDIHKSCPSLAQKMPKTKMVNQNSRKKTPCKKTAFKFWSTDKNIIKHFMMGPSLEKLRAVWLAPREDFGTSNLQIRFKQTNGGTTIA